MFTCNNNQTTYKTNHKFDCNENCLVYLITCNKCLKQYVRQTVDMFTSRWNNYKDKSRKFDRVGDCMQRHFYEYFQLPGRTGFLQAMLHSLTRPILRHTLCVKITGFIPLRQKLL